MFVQLLLEFYLFYFWFVNSDIQTWLSPSTKTNDHIMMDSHLPAPFACTTNSLLMCTSRYSWGWVWTLATTVTVQCKNTPRHTHTHTLLNSWHDKKFKVQMNAGRLQTLRQPWQFSELLMTLPQWSTQRISEGLVPRWIISSSPPTQTQKGTYGDTHESNWFKLPRLTHTPLRDWI